MLRIKGGEVPRAQLGTPALVRESLKLRRGDVWKNLAILVGIPYLKRKLDEGHDIHAPAAGAVVLGPQYAREELPAGASTRQRIQWYYKWFLRKVYPHINMAYYISLLTFQLAYLFDGSKYSSPLLWLVGTRMRRLGEADYRAFEAALNPPSTTASGKARPGQATSLFNPRTFAAAAGPRLLDSLKLLLPTSIFALKFLEWWHASDFARQLSRKAAEGLELPPPIISGRPGVRGSKPKGESTAQDEQITPPSSTSSSPRSKKEKAPPGRAGKVAGFRPRPPISAQSHLPILTVPDTTEESSHLCPICLEPVATATASPYGYVYCYTCIHKWVEGEHERQEKFMQGGSAPAEESQAFDESDDVWDEKGVEGSREGRWESGKGRDAVSGKRILGGTEGLRRVVV